MLVCEAVSTAQQWCEVPAAPHLRAYLAREAAALVDPPLDAAGVGVREGACAPAWLVKVVVGVLF